MYVFMYVRRYALICKLRERTPDMLRKGNTRTRKETGNEALKWTVVYVSCVANKLGYQEVRLASGNRNEGEDAIMQRIMDQSRGLRNRRPKVGNLRRCLSHC